MCIFTDIFTDILLIFFYADLILLRSNLYPFFVWLPVANAWNCHSLYTAFSSNVGAWGMWACSLFLSFVNCRERGQSNHPQLSFQIDSILFWFLGLLEFIFQLAGKEQPLLPRYMIQRAWGLPSIQIEKYIDFNEKGCCVIGGNKCLSVSNHWCVPEDWMFPHYIYRLYAA